MIKPLYKKGETLLLEVDDWCKMEESLACRYKTLYFAEYYFVFGLFTLKHINEWA